MEVILIALTPFVVSLITNGVKKVQTIQISEYKKSIIRVVAVTFSFLGVIGTAWATNSNVDVLSIQTFAETLLIFLGSTGVYFFNKK